MNHWNKDNTSEDFIRSLIVKFTKSLCIDQAGNQQEDGLGTNQLSKPKTKPITSVPEELLKAFIDEIHT